MNDFSDIFLKLNRRLKDMHQQILKRNDVEAYLISCDITELAQELEDVLQKEANKVKQ